MEFAKGKEEFSIVMGVGEKGVEVHTFTLNGNVYDKKVDFYPNTEQRKFLLGQEVKWGDVMLPAVSNKGEPGYREEWGISPVGMEKLSDEESQIKRIRNIAVALGFNYNPQKISESMANDMFRVFEEKRGFADSDRLAYECFYEQLKNTCIPYCDAMLEVARENCYDPKSKRYINANHADVVNYVHEARENVINGLIDNPAFIFMDHYNVIAKSKIEEFKKANNIDEKQEFPIDEKKKIYAGICSSVVVDMNTGYTAKQISEYTAAMCGVVKSQFATQEQIDEYFSGEEKGVKVVANNIFEELSGLPEKMNDAVEYAKDEYEENLKYYRSPEAFAYTIANLGQKSIEVGLEGAANVLESIYYKTDSIADGVISSIYAAEKAGKRAKKFIRRAGESARDIGKKVGDDIKKGAETVKDWLAPRRDDEGRNKS